MRYEEVNGNIFYNGDCIAGAKEHIPDDAIDLIITDPPYGINGDRLHQHYNRDERFVLDGYIEVPAHRYGEFSLAWIREAERILRPGGSIYIVSGYTNLYHILHALRKTHLREVNHIIWRYNFGVYTSRKYVSSHYHILYYEKPGGERTFNLESRYGAWERTADGRSPNYRDREDVWCINREYKPGQTKNKNELPAELLIKMLQYSSNEGDLVCDMFLGGFSTARAAIGLNRRATGFEISGPIFDLRVRELRGIKPGCLLQSLRTPLTERPKNQGRPWTDSDRRALVSRFAILIESGSTKKAAIERLGREFGRGRWSIEKMLKREGILPPRQKAQGSRPG
ncbi:site-specific DNA-methyltransferase [Methanoculleus sp. DTU007]|jgi:site-specific DNA-methyltransferase (adenine-specific)|nr:site-specific DNA-methyltransferase [Methanoculleus sp. DTU007]NLN08940.1 site-specific DNA-methyltransferase [Methanoculleus thermophilus]